MIEQGLTSPQTEMLACAFNPAPADRPSKPHLNQIVRCPRCDSLDTKFCYYNNYSLTQPRYFCKNCKRYWTAGGALRNVPVGGGLRKNKRSKQKEVAAPVRPISAATTDSPLSSEKSPNRSNSSPHKSLVLQGEDASHRFISCPVDGAQFHLSTVRKRVGEKRSIYEASGWKLPPHVSYDDLKDEKVQGPFFGGYSYSLQAAVEESGLPSRYEAGFGGYNLSGPARFPPSQAQSSTTSTSVPIEGLATPPSTTKVYHDPTVEPGYGNQAGLESVSLPPHGTRAAKGQVRRINEVDEEEEGAAGCARGTVIFDELHFQTGKSTNSTGGTHECPASDEVSTGAVINPYDWQLISEGLFGEPTSDYFYMPDTGWPD